jgi:hypothetical protein
MAQELQIAKLSRNGDAENSDPDSETDGKYEINPRHYRKKF